MGRNLTVFLRANSTYCLILASCSAARVGFCSFDCYFTTYGAKSVGSTVAVVFLRSVRSYTTLVATYALHPMVRAIVFLCVVIMSMSKLRIDNVLTYHTNLRILLGSRTTGNMVCLIIRYFASAVFANVPMLIFIFLPASREIMGFCHCGHSRAVLTSDRRRTVTVIIIRLVLCLCHGGFSRTYATGNGGHTVTVVIIRRVLCLCHSGYGSTVFTCNSGCAITVISVRLVLCLCRGGYRATYTTGNCSSAIAVVVIRRMFSKQSSLSTCTFLPVISAISLPNVTEIVNVRKSYRTNFDGDGSHRAIRIGNGYRCRRCRLLLRRASSDNHSRGVDSKPSRTDDRIGIRLFTAADGIAYVYTRNRHVRVTGRNVVVIAISEPKLTVADTDYEFLTCKRKLRAGISEGIRANGKSRDAVGVDIQPLAFAYLILHSIVDTGKGAVGRIGSGCIGLLYTRGGGRSIGNNQFLCQTVASFLAVVKTNDAYRLAYPGVGNTVIIIFSGKLYRIYVFAADLIFHTDLESGEALISKINEYVRCRLSYVDGNFLDKSKLNRLNCKSVFAGRALSCNSNNTDSICGNADRSNERI